MNLKFLFYFLGSISANISVDYHKVVKKLNHKNHHLNINIHSQNYELNLAQNKDKNLYYITLLISDKKVPVNFMIDTGSSLLWMPKGKCVDGLRHQFCGKFIQQDYYGYLDGQINGDMIVTNIYINDTVVNKNAIMMLTTHQDKNVEEPIIGLSYTTTMFPTFLDKMKQNGLIEKIAFTIDMKRQKLIFGTIDEQRDVVEASFEGSGEFLITIDKFRFDDEQLSIKRFCGLIDSGNTLISLPVIFEQSIIQILKQKNLDCKARVEDNPSFSQLYCKLDQSQSIGDFKITISGYEFILTGEDLLETCDLVNESEEESREDDEEYKGYCAMSLEFHNSFSQQTIILGDPFLRKYMATFNLDDQVLLFDITNEKIKQVEAL